MNLNGLWEGSTELLGFRQSLESPSPADGLSLSRVQCERTTSGTCLSKEPVTECLRVSETGWSSRAGSCPYLKGSAGAGWEEWKAKGWALGKVHLGVGGAEKAAGTVREVGREQG